MVGGSSIAHSRGQIMRELMGRANFMSRDMRMAKRANQREQGRLQIALEGKHGISSQYRHALSRTDQDVREISFEMVRTKYKRKCVKPGECKLKFDYNDAFHLVALEEEEKKRRRNILIKEKMKKRTNRADRRVRDFIETMDQERKAERKLSNAEILKIIFDDYSSRPASASSAVSRSSPTIPNPEDMAPDGKLRTKFTLPPLEESWVNARRARYVRTKKLRHFEKELTTQEIFNHRTSLPPINKSNVVNLGDTIG